MIIVSAVGPARLWIGLRIEGPSAEPIEVEAGVSPAACVLITQGASGATAIEKFAHCCLVELDSNRIMSLYVEVATDPLESRPDGQAPSVPEKVETSFRQYLENRTHPSRLTGPASGWTSVATGPAEIGATEPAWCPIIPGDVEAIVVKTGEMQPADAQRAVAPARVRRSRRRKRSSGRSLIR